MKQRTMDPVIDVNKATQDELMALKGVGTTRAKHIVQTRSQHGAFSSLDDLVARTGLPTSVVQRNRKKLYCSGLEKASGSRSVTPIGHGSLDDLSSSQPCKRSRLVGLDDHMGEGTAEPTYGPLDLLIASPSKTSDSDTFDTLSVDLDSADDRVQRWVDVFTTFSAGEKENAVDRFLAACDSHLISVMQSSIKPRMQRDFISTLPYHVALQILSYLSPMELCNSSRVCSSWRSLAKDQSIWRKKLMALDTNYYDDLGSYAISRPPPRRYPPGSDYLETFSKLWMVQMCWRASEHRNERILRGHDDHVITCLQFEGQYIVSGSDDSTLRVWLNRPGSGELKWLLAGHVGGVWCAQMKGEVLASGSTDRTIRVWDLASGECTHVLTGHTSTVRCLALHGTTLVSGSRDSTLKMWDLATGQCMHTFVGHHAAVRGVQYDGRRIVSGAYDCLVKIWDPETKVCLHTLQGHGNRVYSLQYDGRYIASGSLDSTVKIWDAETGQCLHTLLGHQSLTSSIIMKDNHVITGNADSQVRVWSLETGQCLLTMAGARKHSSAVTSIQVVHGMLVSSSDDGSVKLWSLETGQFVRDLLKLDSGGNGGVVWRIKCSSDTLVCAVGSRNGTEETKLYVLSLAEL